MHSLAQVVRLAIRFAWDNFNKLRQLPFSSNVHMHENVPPIFYLVAMWQYTTKSEYESLLPLIHSSGDKKGPGKKKLKLSSRKNSDLGVEPSTIQVLFLLSHSAGQSDSAGLLATKRG